MRCRRSSSNLIDQKRLEKREVGKWGFPVQQGGCPASVRLFPNLKALVERRKLGASCLLAPSAAMSRINLHSMQILASVAATKSLTRSAAELNMTTSAVSKRVAELEARFGTPLLIRHATGVRLTAAGEVVAQCADDLMTRVAEMTQEIADLLARQSGEVRIMSNIAAILLGLLDDVKQFRASHPGIRVLVSEGNSPETAEAVKKNQVDIGVCVRTDFVKGLACRPYRQTRLVVVMPDTHPLAARTVISPKELQGYPLVWKPPVDLGIEDGPKARQSSDLGSQVGLAIRSFEVVLHTISEGAGIAVVPNVAVPRNRPEGLAIAQLSAGVSQFELIVCHDPSVHKDPAAQQMLAWLCSRADRTEALGSASNQ